MNEIYDFLKNAGTYFLATSVGSIPKVRPFGTINLFEGKLYIQTGKIKEVSKQMHQNPNVEICAFKDGEWIRVSAKAILDDRNCARQSMLDNYPSLQSMYKADDGNTEVFYLDDLKAIIYSFTSKPREIKE